MATRIGPRIGGVLKNALMLGQCVASSKHGAVQNAVKVKVTVAEYNDFLHMYFQTSHRIYAHDPKLTCRDGDTVLIEKLENKYSTDITHKVLKIIYDHGDITDPVTGKKCAGIHYRSTQKAEQEAYGIAEGGTGGFDYDKAPPRGWQEGKKDFTTKEGYQKWHEFEKGHRLSGDKTST